MFISVKTSVFLCLFVFSTHQALADDWNTVVSPVEITKNSNQVVPNNPVPPPGVMVVAPQTSWFSGIYQQVGVDFIHQEHTELHFQGEVFPLGELNTRKRKEKFRLAFLKWIKELSRKKLKGGKDNQLLAKRSTPHCQFKLTYPVNQAGHLRKLLEYKAFARAGGARSEAQQVLREDFGQKLKLTSKADSQIPELLVDWIKQSGVTTYKTVKRNECKG